MINTVIFDLDGLLIDSEIISYQIDCDLAGKYGCKFEKETYVCNYSGKTGIENMKNLIKTYNLPISIEEGLEFVAAREKEYFNKGVALKDGALELLKFLKENNFKIVLASSSKRKRAESVLAQNNILDYFDEMVFGVEVEKGKPFPDIFLKACEKADQSPENCLVLEDSEAGIKAAYSAGIKVICIPDMKFPREKFKKMTTEILNSLADVIKFLKADC